MKTKLLPLLKASALVLPLCIGSVVHAQTTLSGDHIVTGDLNVGTSGTTGNLLVTGDTGNSAPPGLKVTGDGGVVFTGSLTAGQIPVTGAGTRFMWYPKKAALRAGEVWGTKWNDGDIGEASVALGKEVRASGGASVALGGFGTATNAYSVSIGDNNTSSGQAAVALGWGNLASGFFSVALGETNDATARGATASGANNLASGTNSTAFGAANTASGYASLAIGAETLASGFYSAAFGSGSVASGAGAMAMGDSTLASGDTSFAAGGSTVSSGWASTATGFLTLSSGDLSAAFGFSTEASSYASFVIGRYNAGGGSPDEWDGEDTLFEVGNGTGDPGDPPEVKNRNAFTVYKNGNVVIPKRQGDILMGEFGNPE